MYLSQEKFNRVYFTKLAFPSVNIRVISTCGLEQNVGVSLTSKIGNLKTMTNDSVFSPSLSFFASSPLIVKALFWSYSADILSTPLLSLTVLDSDKHAYF